MVLMNAGKAARNAASITNSGKIYGTMGGLVPHIGVDNSVRSMQRSRGNTKMLPMYTVAQMKEKGLLSVNPQVSGGVGKKVLMHFS